MRLKKENTGFYLSVIFTVLWTGLIFSFSAQSKTNSMAASDSAFAFLSSLFASLNIDRQTAVFAIRKLAHFSEYFIFGALITLSMIINKAKMMKPMTAIKTNAFKLLFIILIVPVIDETIQIFSQRGPLVQDIWIDFSGAVCGVLAMLFIMSVAFNKKERSKRKSTAK
ncbi:MAG: VanZ family protein [Acutalibacteraceae bacterium]